MFEGIYAAFVSTCTTENHTVNQEPYSILSDVVFTMDRRSCRDCGKGIKSLSGLSRHRTRCPVLLGQRKRVVPKHSPVSEPSTDNGPDNQMSNSMQLHLCGPEEDRESYQEEDKDCIDINEDTGSDYLSVDWPRSGPVRTVAFFGDRLKRLDRTVQHLRTAVRSGLFII